VAAQAGRVKEAQMARWTCVLAAAALAAAPPPAAAQDQRGFDMNLFQLAPGNGSFLTVEGADVPSGIGWFAGGLLDYQHRPVLVRTCLEQSEGGCTDWGGTQAALVEHHLSAEVAGGISVLRIFEAGVVLPVVLFQQGEGVDGPATVQELAGQAGIGDVRLHLKLDLLHGVFRQKSDTFGLALVPVLSFPTGRLVHSDSFMGDSLVTVHTRLAFAANVGRVRIGANLGYMWREKKDFFLADMSHRLTYGVAAEIKIVAPLFGVVELFGQNGFSEHSASSPLEADGALRYRFPMGLTLTVGAGAGIVAGVGTPAFRVFTALMYRPPRVGEPVDEDRDGDGVLNIHDECPDEPEDRDAFEDGDGCPDPDNDADGFLDADDECPREAEDEDGFEDGDGCPDLDHDGDGIPDADDECPREAEVHNGFEDDDGCPDEGEAILEVQKDKIVLMENIHFATDSHEIVGEKSFEVLDAIVKILESNPKMELVIEGHTDNRGTLGHNMKLSKDRAESVKDYLVSHGIDAGRLETEGHGPTKPIADNTTKKGRARNRRVEFRIVQP
jgi:outer membrane protein OmpA-like peptidoglycan-associated protein